MCRLLFSVKYLLRVSGSMLNHGILKMYIWKFILKYRMILRNETSIANLICVSIKSSSDVSEVPRICYKMSAYN